MTRSKRIWLGAAGIVVLVAAALNAYLGGRYVVIGPGPTRELSQMVRVEGGARDSRGSFLLTAVESSRAGLVSLVRAAASPTVDLVPRDREIPAGMSTDEYLRVMRSMMRESQVVAGAVALRKLGFAVKVASVVRVEEVLRGSPASGVLREGDALVAVDGRPAATAEEATRRIGARAPGDSVELTVRRDGVLETFTLGTIPHPEDRRRAAVGVLVSSSASYDPPMEIDIDAGDIMGSSAGLMLALEILDQLDPSDLTRGLVVAGTGSIGLDGSVGPVAGVKQKVAAAERAGAELFLVPMEDVAAASAAARVAEVVGVDDLEDALVALGEAARRKTGRAGE